MPMTAATALVLLIAVVPGALGSYLYEVVNGLNWREKDWGAAIRYVAFSAVGLATYVLGASQFGWWPAVHVVPATYVSSNFAAAALPRILFPFLGHVLAGGLVGVGAAWAARGVAWLTGSTPRPGAWDVFVKDSAPDRWVVATLKSGDVFAGYVLVADAGVPCTDRDMVLREPALYDPERKAYIATGYRDIFLPAELVQNVAAMRLSEDGRVGPDPGQPLFREEEADEGQADTPNAVAHTPA